MLTSCVLDKYEDKKNMLSLKVIRANNIMNRNIDAVGTMTRWRMILWGDAIVSYVISKKGRAGQWKKKLNIETYKNINTKCFFIRCTSPSRGDFSTTRPPPSFKSIDFQKCKLTAVLLSKCAAHGRKGVLFTKHSPFNISPLVVILN